MPEGDKINALVNIGQSKTVEKAYDDAASPPMKKIGEALSTILDIGNTALWPVKWANAKVRMFFENNLRKYEEKLKGIPGDSIARVPTEIAIPILERFNYVTNEQLSDAFVKLLTTASDIRTSANAHPAFITIIDRITPDEAKILKYFFEHKSLASLTFAWAVENKTGHKPVFIEKTLISQKVELLFPHNDGVYLDNLISLGLIGRSVDFVMAFVDDYGEIKAANLEQIDLHKPGFITHKNELNFEHQEQGNFAITDFGMLFLKACISE